MDNVFSREVKSFYNAWKGLGVVLILFILSLVLLVMAKRICSCTDGDLCGNPDKETKAYLCER
jgi:hypothetical protein